MTDVIRIGVTQEIAKVVNLPDGRIALHLPYEADGGGKDSYIIPESSFGKNELTLPNGTTSRYELIGDSNEDKFSNLNFN